MKRIGMLLACVAALALPAASFADGGTGGARFAGHPARAQAHVANYTEKCKVATPAAKCTEARARMLARFDAWEARLQERIAKLEQLPASEKRTTRLAELRSRLAQVNALETKLS
jgi:hypothetical protein